MRKRSQKMETFDVPKTYTAAYGPKTSILQILTRVAKKKKTERWTPWEAGTPWGKRRYVINIVSHREFGFSWYLYGHPACVCVCPYFYTDTRLKARIPRRDRPLIISRFGKNLRRPQTSETQSRQETNASHMSASLKRATLVCDASPWQRKKSVKDKGKSSADTVRKKKRNKNGEGN